MTTYINIAIILLLIDFWTNEAIDIDKLRPLKDRFNYKPFNCGYCLSFRIGLALSIAFLNPIYITLPLLYKLLTK